eukprot:g8273.t1
MTVSASADDGLLARWKLTGDVRDSSGHNHHLTNRHVRFETFKRGKREFTAATFDGATSRLELAADRVPRIGKNAFTISAWVHCPEKLDHVPGNIISHFDPKTRTGFHLSIDSRPGVTSSQSNSRQVHFGIDAGTPNSKWTDHGRLGKAVLIYGMAVYRGQLFAGTCVAGKNEAGRVYRFDGKAWHDCGAPDKCNAVSSLAVYRGRLYVGVSKYRLRGSSLTESDNPNLGGTVYRYEADGKWESCGRLPKVEAINGMVVFNGKLYASSMYAPAGFFRYEGGTKWTSLPTPGGKRVESLTVYNGAIYASGYDEGAVYRYDGTNWSHLGRVGQATQTYGFAVYRGDLYVSEWPNAEVYRYGGGKKWHLAGRLGDEKETMPLVVYNGKMYGGTLPTGSVFRYEGNTRWTKFARLDLTPDVRYRRVWSMAVFQGRMFAGTLPAGRVHSIEVGKNVTHDTALTPGWHHVAAVRSKNRLTLYIDGRQVAQSTEFDGSRYDLTNTSPLHVGFGSHDHLRGSLSDVRIYNHPLTAADISKLARQPTPFCKGGYNDRGGFSTVVVRGPEQGVEGMTDVVMVGDAVPEFSVPAVSAVDVGVRRAELKAYRGRWLMLVFYPRDFSFVCPTELTAFSGRMEEFRKRDCDLLGVSVDTIELHKEWLETAPEDGGLGAVRFPLASDADGAVAARFGVWVEEERVALRGLFIIDPAGVLQYSVVHNLSVGRSTDEVLRVLDALRSGGLCPVSWTNADGVLDVQAALQPGRVLGHYRIREVLGVGSFGTVFAAWDLHLERVVALKVLGKAGDASREELLTEARAAAALNHPNICTVFAIDEIDGLPLIAMEFLPGPSLAELISQGMDATQAVKLAKQIALALAAAHEHDLVHGDLKPGNIMLSATGSPRILDFGLARRGSEKGLRFHSEPTGDGAVDESRDSDGTVIMQVEGDSVSGTPAYMSPEQASGEALTPASDVFSFGLTFYEMLTGKRAIAEANPLEAVLRLRSEDLAESLASELPAPYRPLAGALLKQQPRHRPGMVDVAELLEQIQNER